MAEQSAAGSGRLRAPRVHRARRRSGRFRAILSLGIVLGFGAVSTTAYWTDEATVTGGTFQAGTIDIAVGNPPVDNDPPAFTTTFEMSNMVPGSTRDAPLRVTNAGTVPFAFQVDGSATNSGGGNDQLGAALRISVFGAHNGTTCTGSALVSDVPANGSLLPTQAVLAVDGTRELCFRATLPSGAHTALQGQQSVVTLTLIATSEPA